MWLVIETFCDFRDAVICTDEDGKNFVFYNEDDARFFAEENCNNAVVVKVD